MSFQFWHRKKSTSDDNREQVLTKINVAVVAFADNCTENCGQEVYSQLVKDEALEVRYFDDYLPKQFLDLQQGNFFDLLENGNAILKKTQADVLVWGCRQGHKIRVNVQKAKHYDEPELPFFSLLNGLSLPLSFFQENAMPAEVVLLIKSMIFALCRNEDNLNHLNDILEKIGQSSMPEGLALEDMSYVLNLLSVVYLRAKNYQFKSLDANVVLQMLRKGFELVDNYKDNIGSGCLYANAGQFFALIAAMGQSDKYANIRKSIECFRFARKFLGRYIFPYDCGWISYQLSRQYFEFWKQTNDIQALRDSVFYLREAEKIFTIITFPKFWAIVQKKLGYCLSLLGGYGKNDEILMLAVDNYKNCQKIFTTEEKPLEWAKCEESIGNILYSIGKMHSNIEYLEESKQYFAAAADVYEEKKQVKALRQMRICQSKSEEQILLLQSK